MEYIPDKWVVVDYGQTYGKDRYAVLAGWYVGFTGSSSWKRSSSIQHTDFISDDQICCTTYSGSTYILHKGRIGLTMFTGSLIEEAKLGTLQDWDEIVKAFKGERDEKEIC